MREDVIERIISFCAAGPEIIKKAKGMHSKAHKGHLPMPTMADSKGISLLTSIC